MIAGVCILAFVLAIAECRIDTPSAKQSDDCGDVNDTSTKLGQCSEAVGDDDLDEFCDSDCVEVVKDYYECIEAPDSAIDELEEICDAPTVETDDAITVSAISTVTAILRKNNY